MLLSVVVVYHGVYLRSRLSGRRFPQPSLPKRDDHAAKKPVTCIGTGKRPQRLGTTAGMRRANKTRAFTATTTLLKANSRGDATETGSLSRRAHGHTPMPCFPHIVARASSRMVEPHTY